MKKIKVFLTVILALVMLTSVFAFSASADDPDPIFSLWQLGHDQGYQTMEKTDSGVKFTEYQIPGGVVSNSYVGWADHSIDFSKPVYLQFSIDEFSSPASDEQGSYPAWNNVACFLMQIDGRIVTLNMAKNAADGSGHIYVGTNYGNHVYGFTFPSIVGNYFFKIDLSNLQFMYGSTDDETSWVNLYPSADWQIENIATAAGTDTETVRKTLSFTNDGDTARGSFESRVNWYADANARGKWVYTFQRFGDYIMNVPADAFSGASLTLQNNLKLNFAAKKSVVDALDADPTVTFTTGSGYEISTTEKTESGDYYLYSFSDIGPDRMGVDITAKLTGTFNGGTTPYVSNSKTYSVKDYCEDVLAATVTDDGNSFYQLAADKKSKLQALLVDLLNYGAASQMYVGYDTANLVNADLTPAQQAFGTAGTPTLSATRSVDGTATDTAWYSVLLNLKDTVGIKYTLDTKGNTVTSVKITKEDGTPITTIDSGSFTDVGDGKKVILFNSLTAIQMRDTVKATAYNGDTAVSKTLSYSIAAYATQKKDQGNALSDLVIAMMKYGDSAVAYKGTLN